jgi:hypothetical protein
MFRDADKSRPREGVMPMPTTTNAAAERPAAARVHEPRSRGALETKSRARRPVLPDTWPARHLELQFPDPVYPIPPETAHSIRIRVAGFARLPKEEQDQVRELANALGLHGHCPREQCRRGGQCSTRYVFCIFEQKTLIEAGMAQEG